MAEAAEVRSQISFSAKFSFEKPWILDTIVKLPEAREWSGEPEGEPYNPFKLVNLSASSAEFRQVEAHFKASVYATPILKIQRVENPFLLAQYLMKKKKMGCYATEKLLFHGTRQANVAGICKDNFNWRLRGRSRGHKFGQGTSFARDAYYATHYSQGSNIMICSKVLVGNSTIGSPYTIVPPRPFDTTQNDKGTVIVKYEDDDYYPSYIIHHGTVTKLGPTRSKSRNYEYDDMLDLFDDFSLYYC